MRPSPVPGRGRAAAHAGLALALVAAAAAPAAERLVYVPSFEGPLWRVVDGATGASVATVVTHSGAHNTIYGLDGRRVYLAGLRSPVLRVADPRTHAVVGDVGPFGQFIRPFTV